ncbi:hypothetical protein WICPIJ_008753 [Wickerhamomyces pijperi]|uniref:Uncharacterized protein n=1 Tax=Wickerhamomyces pijperi TaxID=599730 RepID=A0A9P8PVN7_WICPI|nr:hypothetical protein WICPIJ_008753 [Wickerhamomyces pijperi]
MELEVGRLLLGDWKENRLRLCLGVIITLGVGRWLSEEDLGGVICVSSSRLWPLLDLFIRSLLCKLSDEPELGMLSPNNSFFNTVEKVLLASSSFLNSKSAELEAESGLKDKEEEEDMSSLADKLKAACRSTPVRLGMYLSLYMTFFFLGDC